MLGEDPRERVSVGHLETQPGTGRGIKAASRDRKHRDKDGDRDQEPERHSKEAGGVRGLSFLRGLSCLDMAKLWRPVDCSWGETGLCPHSQMPPVT